MWINPSRDLLKEAFASPRLQTDLYILTRRPQKEAAGRHQVDMLACCFLKQTNKAVILGTGRTRGTSQASCLPRRRAAPSIRQSHPLPSERRWLQLAGCPHATAAGFRGQLLVTAPAPACPCSLGQWAPQAAFTTLLLPSQAHYQGHYWHTLKSRPWIPC